MNLSSPLPIGTNLDGIRYIRLYTLPSDGTYDPVSGIRDMSDTARGQGGYLSIDMADDEPVTVIDITTHGWHQGGAGSPEDATEDKTRTISDPTGIAAFGPRNAAVSVSAPIDALPAIAGPLFAARPPRYRPQSITIDDRHDWRPGINGTWSPPAMLAQLNIARRGITYTTRIARETIALDPDPSERFGTRCRITYDLI